MTRPDPAYTRGTETVRVETSQGRVTAWHELPHGGSYAEHIAARIPRLTAWRVRCWLHRNGYTRLHPEAGVSVAGMDPVAFYDALNNLATAVLFAEGDPDEDRRQIGENAFIEASVAALTVFPDGTAEAAALGLLVDAVSAFTRTQVPA